MIQLKGGFGVDIVDTTIQDSQLYLEYSYNGDDKVYTLKVGDGNISYNDIP